MDFCHSFFFSFYLSFLIPLSSWLTHPYFHTYEWIYFLLPLHQNRRERVNPLFISSLLFFLALQLSEIGKRGKKRKKRKTAAATNNEACQISTLVVTIVTCTPQKKQTFISRYAAFWINRALFLVWWMINRRSSF